MLFKFVYKSVDTKEIEHCVYRGIQIPMDVSLMFFPLQEINEIPKHIRLRLTWRRLQT